jgi:cob(I)alamin adenosyltransferase
VYHVAVKIYTRTGDQGLTSLLSGGRVAKDDARVEAYGCLDELSSLLGLLRTEPLPAGTDQRLELIQRALLDIGAALADREQRHRHDPGAWSSEPLEQWIDEMDQELPPLRAFILPGGSRAAAVAHLARTVCRRAERRTQTVAGLAGGVPEGVLPYLNRLSDAFFTLARWINLRLGIDTPARR